MTPMLEDLDHLASRVQQLVQFAESARSDMARQAYAARLETTRLTAEARAEKEALAERLARSEEENRHLRRLLIAARDRVDDVLTRIPDPEALRDAANEAHEESANGTT